MGPGKSREDIRTRQGDKSEQGTVVAGKGPADGRREVRGEAGVSGREETEFQMADR